MSLFVKPTYFGTPVMLTTTSALKSVFTSYFELNRNPSRDVLVNLSITHVNVGSVHIDFAEDKMLMFTKVCEIGKSMYFTSTTKYVPDGADTIGLAVENGLLVIHWFAPPDNTTNQRTELFSPDAAAFVPNVVILVGEESRTSIEYTGLAHPTQTSMELSIQRTRLLRREREEEELRRPRHEVYQKPKGYIVQVQRQFDLLSAVNGWDVEKTTRGNFDAFILSFVSDVFGRQTSFNVEYVFNAGFPFENRNPLYILEPKIRSSRVNAESGRVENLSALGDWKGIMDTVKAHVDRILEELRANGAHVV